jgi:ABC-type branched-subunit amino acid transport system ATPase component
MDRTVRTLAAVLALAVSFAVSAQTGPIKIFNIVELSGGGATAGTNFDNGVKLAVKEINAGGGILGRRIDLQSLDTQTNPGVAKALSQKAVADGIAFVPHGRNLFGSPSVRHNLELGGITLPRGELGGRIEEVLTRFPRIRERLDNQASTMSGGEQKQLEVGRALLLRPRVILIDEPSIGLSPKLVQEVMALLRGLADGGTTVLMVEQNVRTALKYANRALVLEMGRLALDRPASELLQDPDLNRLFLGGHAEKKSA